MNNGTFPKSFETLASTLSVFGMARTGCTLLPQYFTNFGRLKYLDARDNFISSLTTETSSWIKKGETSNFQLYLSGNKALCSNKEKFKVEKECEALCSKYCWSKNSGGNKVCDFSCNSKSCASEQPLDLQPCCSSLAILAEGRASKNTCI